MSILRNIFAILFLAAATPALAGESSVHITPPLAIASSGALAALEKIFADYSEGQTLRAEAMVEPAMIGYQQLIDSMRLSVSLQKQIRITLHDSQTVSGAGVVVIRTGWSKRYLSMPGMAPIERKGQTIFLMQQTKNGWKLAGQSGDNIFAP